MAKKTTKKTTKKMGRPVKKISLDNFEALCGLQCTLEEIANFLKVSSDTVERRVEEEYGERFAEVYKKKRLGGITSLRRKLYSCAMQGDKTLLIWLDKKYAHLQGDVDQRCYGGRTEDSIAALDKKIDINISFVDLPDEAAKEKALHENMTDED